VCSLFIGPRPFVFIFLPCLILYFSNVVNTHRLEDYLCYAASTVEALGNVMEGTTALEPFTPIKMFQKEF